jgi:hypothetical protein
LNTVFQVLRGTMPQDAGAPSLSIAVLENQSPTQGYRKEPPFPH